jgi:hypothetical protein
MNKMRMAAADDVRDLINMSCIWAYDEHDLFHYFDVDFFASKIFRYII